MNLNRRTRDLAKTAAEPFDSTVLHNRVYEQVQGQHGESQLRRLLDISEECYDLADERERATDRDDVVYRVAFDAAESLNGHIRALIDEEIATACAVIVRDAPEWTDAWDDAELEAATYEAREWLQLHLEAAERAGVLEDVEVRA